MPTNGINDAMMRTLSSSEYSHSWVEFSGIARDLQDDSLADIPEYARYAQTIRKNTVILTILASTIVPIVIPKIAKERVCRIKKYTTEEASPIKIIRLARLACHRTNGCDKGVPSLVRRNNGPRKRYAMSALIRVEISGIRRN